VASADASSAVDPTGSGVLVAAGRLPPQDDDQPRLGEETAEADQEPEHPALLLADRSTPWMVRNPREHAASGTGDGARLIRNA
jgi:hypothetical protein